MLWGFSPAVDLLEETKCHFGSFNYYDEMNILLIGCLDPRHILKTIAQRYRDDKPIRINFYLIEVCMEVFARQLLLLTVALEPSDKLGLREKARLYMEIFANALLRPTSAIYIIDKTLQFTHCVTDTDFLNKRLPCIKLDKLKYKERDSLENIFKFWQKERFKISKLWDSRLRQDLGTRYDCREGVFDWDYHMKLKDVKGCEVISSREYVKWRETGVAFTWLETEFSVPNPTFAFGVTKVGDELLNFGYRADIKFGPYFTFGLECPDEEMSKTINGVRAQRSTDITQRNLMRLFYEIENNRQYFPEPSENDICMGLVVSDIGNINVEDTYVHPEPNREIENYSCLPIDHTISFLPLNSINDMPKKPSFKNIFDIVYLSQALVEKTCKLTDLTRDNSVLIVETHKAFFSLKNEEKIRFSEKIDKFTSDNGFEKLFDYDPVNDYYCFFKKTTNVSDLAAP